MRDLDEAGRAPACPEIEQHDPAAERLKIDRLSPRSVRTKDGATIPAESFGGNAAAVVCDDSRTPAQSATHKRHMRQLPRATG